MIEELAARICRLQKPHTIRVAIDGVDGAGKTTLADELVEPVRRLGRPVIRASVDDFHRPRHLRYRRGRWSPEGYFRDSFDYELLKEVLLEPLGPGGSGRYRGAVFDHRNDAAVDAPWLRAERDAVLLFDGVFLHRPELLPHWDLSMFLWVPFDVAIARAAGREGSCADVDAPENRRYVLGQKLYIEECRPASRASILIDNTDLGDPRWKRA